MSKLFKPATLVVAMASALFSNTVFAQETVEVNALDPIVVTANRIDTTSKNVLASIIVIDRQEIEQKQYTSLLEALISVPSIAISNSGGAGKISSISIRGTSNRHVLVLVDGQKVGSATLGETAFEHFPISQIERIEVVNGARSGIYGSEAVGGVIQIFTRKNNDSNGIKAFGSTTIGSHQSYQGNLGLSATSDQAWATLNIATEFTDGFNATNIQQIQDLDKDGYKNKSAFLRTGYRFNDRLKLDAHALMVDAKNDYDYSDWGATDTTNVHGNIKQNVYGIGANIKPLNAWDLNIKVGRSEDKLDSRDGFPSIINTQRDTINIQNTLTLPANQKVVIGADYQQDKISGTTNYAVKERDNKGYYAQYLAQFNGLNMQGAVRLDDNEQFGNKTTGNIALGYQFNDTIQAYASYATAYKAPTFNDLYWPGSENPTLVPEQSKNYELGFKGSLFNLDWQLNGFQNKIDNMIVWAPNRSGNWVPSNVDKAEIKGIELALGQKLDKLSWNASYTYQDPTNKTIGANTNNQLVLRAKQLAKFSADYDLTDKLSTGLSIYASDKRYINVSNTSYLSGFATADFRISYRILPEFLVQAKLANAFDKTYHTHYGNSTLYTQDGRTGWLTFRYDMK
ncbi:TonB-dependent receptor domain-containing protein [Moraxella sp. ZY210820]|uniref:TonB-dependent receptor domain-containing protein n=1 Tax=unclassified Moraxella TaxID=2685852 RepID=UPI0027313DAD|nr:TonB-dependent receptor [Moraxella sp. ZY210820]WLF84532.1 TonB-dependent receptor [Moraxella sp. ZY210820]